LNFNPFAVAIKAAKAAKAAIVYAILSPVAPS
jgi:hypothetical protein